MRITATATARITIGVSLPNANERNTTAELRDAVKLAIAQQFSRMPMEVISIENPDSLHFDTITISVKP